MKIPPKASSLHRQRAENNSNKHPSITPRLAHGDGHRPGSLLPGGRPPVRRPVAAMASSGALQMRPHAAKGRALYSRRAFAPGATMELFAAPLVLLPSVDRLADVCAHCLRPGRVRACAGCGAAFYCGPRCQAAAWKRVHGRECRLLRERRLDNQTGAALPTPVRALIQLLLRPQAEAAVAPLEGHLADRRAEPTGWADLEMMARAACLFAGRALDRVEIDKAAELLCKVRYARPWALLHLPDAH